VVDLRRGSLRGLALDPGPEDRGVSPEEPLRTRAGGKYDV
jgi:hypothetical protein